MGYHFDKVSLQLDQNCGSFIIVPFFSQGHFFRYSLYMQLSRATAFQKLVNVRMVTQILTGVSNCLDTLVNFQKEHLCR